MTSGEEDAKFLLLPSGLTAYRKPSLTPKAGLNTSGLSQPPVLFYPSHDHSACVRRFLGFECLGWSYKCGSYQYRDGIYLYHIHFF